jgi:hypothetical protein
MTGNDSARPANTLMQNQCIARLKATAAEITRVRGSGLVYQDAERTLDLLQQSIQVQSELVADACTQTTLEEACAASLQVLSWVLPVLGMVVRSSNLRIAFELYPPLKQLTNRLLADQSPVLLSSDWDYYPTTLLGLHCELVVIGLPATESSNALLIPLAGHELGHHLWSKRHYARSLGSSVTSLLLQKIRNEYWQQFLSDWPGLAVANVSKTDLEQLPEYRQHVRRMADRVVRQLEEYFCDALALELFAESYLHALRYLTLPGRTERVEHYPSMQSRVHWLRIRSNQRGITVPEHFTDSFSMPLTVSAGLTLLDSLVEPIVPEVQQLAKSIVEGAKLPSRDHSCVERIADKFASFAPQDDEQSLTDIINAGWLACSKYQSESGVDPERWREIMNQLTLKTCEISRFHQKTAQRSVT